MNHWFDSKYSVAWFQSVVFWLGAAWLRFGSSHLSCLPSLWCVQCVFTDMALFFRPGHSSAHHAEMENRRICLNALLLLHLVNLCVLCLSWLRTTIAVTGAFLDAFQKVADMATSTRGMQKANTPTVTLTKHQIVFSLVGWDENQWEVREICFVCVSGCLFHHVSEGRKIVFSSQQRDLWVFPFYF